MARSCGGAFTHRNVRGGIENKGDQIEPWDLPEEALLVCCQNIRLGWRSQQVNATY
jgi:hypothetical protein